jgi:hypothetical protein
MFPNYCINDPSGGKPKGKSRAGAVLGAGSKGILPVKKAPSIKWTGLF